MASFSNSGSKASTAISDSIGGASLFSSSSEELQEHTGKRSRQDGEQSTAYQQFADKEASMVKKMKKMVNTCGATGYAYGIILANGNVATGSSISMQEWWMNSVRFGESAPEAARKHERERMQALEEKEGKYAKPSSELLFELADAILSSLLSTLMPHCDPPQRRFPLRRGLPPPWWPDGTEDLWVEMGLVEAGQPMVVPYRKPHDLNKGVKIGVLVSVIRHMAPAFEKILHYVRTSRFLQDRMTARDDTIWVRVVHKEITRYNRRRPKVPNAEASGHVGTGHLRIGSLSRPSTAGATASGPNAGPFTCDHPLCCHSHQVFAFHTSEALERHMLKCALRNKAAELSLGQALGDAVLPVQSTQLMPPTWLTSFEGQRGLNSELFDQSSSLPLPPSPVAYSGSLEAGFPAGSSSWQGAGLLGNIVAGTMNQPLLTSSQQPLLGMSPTNPHAGLTSNVNSVTADMGDDILPPSPAPKLPDLAASLGGSAHHANRQAPDAASVLNYIGGGFAFDGNSSTSNMAVFGGNSSTSNMLTSGDNYSTINMELFGINNSASNVEQIVGNNSTSDLEAFVSKYFTTNIDTYGRNTSTSNIETFDGNNSIRNMQGVAAINSISNMHGVGGKCSTNSMLAYGGDNSPSNIGLYGGNPSACYMKGVIGNNSTSNVDVFGGQYSTSNMWLFGGSSSTSNMVAFDNKNSKSNIERVVGNNSTSKAETFGGKYSTSNMQPKTFGGKYSTSNMRPFGVNNYTSNMGTFGSNNSIASDMDTIVGNNSTSNGEIFGGKYSTNNIWPFGGNNSISNTGAFGCNNSTSNMERVIGNISSSNMDGVGGNNSTSNMVAFDSNNSISNLEGFGGNYAISNMWAFGGKNSSSKVESFGGNNSSSNMVAFGGNNSTGNMDGVDGNNSTSNVQVFGGKYAISNIDAPSINNSTSSMEGLSGNNSTSSMEAFGINNSTRNVERFDSNNSNSNTWPFDVNNPISNIETLGINTPPNNTERFDGNNHNGNMWPFGGNNYTNTMMMLNDNYSPSNMTAASMIGQAPIVPNNGIFQMEGQVGNMTDNYSQLAFDLSVLLTMDTTDSGTGGLPQPPLGGPALHFQ